MLGRMPTAPVAALSLIAGFAVVDVTGIRPLGGMVLLAALAWCALRWRRAAGLPASLGLAALYALAFGASHALGDAIGAWPAVLLVAAGVGAAAWAVADAPRPRTA
jgi:hypothetical protein